VAVLEILKGEVESNLSAPSYFIANEHNELYTRFIRERRLTAQNLRPIGGVGTAAPLPRYPFLISPLFDHSLIDWLEDAQAQLVVVHCMKNFLKRRNTNNTMQE